MLHYKENDKLIFMSYNCNHEKSNASLAVGLLLDSSSSILDINHFHSSLILESQLTISLMYEFLSSTFFSLLSEWEAKVPKIKVNNCCSIIISFKSPRLKDMIILFFDN